MQLLVFLQFQTLVKSLPADLTHWAEFATVLPHVIQQILLFAKHITTSVTLVLHPPGVDWHMLFQAVEPREFSRADGATEEATVILLGITRILDFRHFVCKQRNVMSMVFSG